MFPKFLPKLLLLGVAALVFVVIVGYRDLPKVKAQIKRFDKPKPCTSCAADASQLIYAPTIDMPESEGADIVLNSRSLHAMDAVPTFYTANGEAVVGETIHLEPTEMRFVSIESLIPPEHRGQHKWGGMSLSYTGRPLGVWAQITLRSKGKKGSADVTFSVIGPGGPETQDALWLMPKAAKAVLVR